MTFDMPVLSLPPVTEDDLIYPFFPLDRSERKTGTVKASRFKDRLKSTAIFDIPRLQPYFQAADHRYHNGGRWTNYNLWLKEGYDGPEVWAVMNAMMDSPLPNHIQRFVAVGLGLYNWFAFPTPEEQKEIDKCRN